MLRSDVERTRKENIITNLLSVLRPLSVKFGDVLICWPQALAMRL